jgi:cell division protein FtsA
MKKQQAEPYVAGIDIGSASVRAIIARPDGAGGINVVGIGETASKGLRKGVVVNLDATVEAVKAAIEEAELMAGFVVQEAFVGVAGQHVKGLNSRGVVAVPHADQSVLASDVVRVVEAAKAIQIPKDREILHALPQDFTVDEQEDVADPVGMQGQRLEANVHVVTVSAQSTQNLITCANRAGVRVRSMVLETLASAEVALTDDEKELGVLLVDVGGGTCDIAVFEKGAIWHASTITVGGEHFTNDIAVGLRTPVPDAERIKRKHGIAVASLAPDDEAIEIPSVGGRPARMLSLHVLAEIIGPRAEEMFSLIKADVEKAGFSKSLNGGVVLTGGGSLLPGMVEVCEHVFELPVRQAGPKGIGGMGDVVASPTFATAAGLVAWGFRNVGPSADVVEEPQFQWGGLPGRVAGWFSDIFEPVASAVGSRRARQ